MTSQLLTATSAFSVSGISTATKAPEAASGDLAFSEARTRLMESMKKSAYQANHQVQVLNLQAEAEALLLQLQTLKQRRLATQETVAE